MKCRKNIRKLIQEYNAATPATKPNTPLIKFRQALVAMKAAPSRLSAPHTTTSRYDDYVYVHQQSMAGHPNSDPGPHSGHKGPAFFSWHREFLRQFENDLRAVSGDASVCLAYWDWSVDQAPANAGYPFFDEFLGGDGGPNDEVQTGVFARANGWILNVNDDPGDALQRTLGQDTANLPPRSDVIAALAVNKYDESPWNRDSAAANSFRNRIEGWTPSPGPRMHNRVHVWVGGSMGPSTSPNDPVFFLNHVMEDALWAVWSQKYPTVPHYLPLDSEPLPAGHTHLKRLSDHMEGLAEYFGAGTIDRPIDLLDHKAITWYDIDLPDIIVESGPAVGFNNTPAGLTVGKLIRFRVQSCRPLTLSITGAPAGNFAMVGGPDFLVTPVEAKDFEILEVEVRFHAVGANVQVSAVDFEARILDEEGFYAANAGDAYVVAKFHIELVANNIITSDSSVALVLDRSGSMADVANSGFTKSLLLKSAVGVLHALMQDNDQIGIARFDHEADALLAMTPKSAGLGTTLTGNGLDPRGATSIGAGILVGSGLINGPGATKPNKALVVLTDGNENTDPLISALPGGTINQTTFAVGLGLPGQVSDPILTQISANSGGYLLVTGNMTDDTERFKLAKLFIQILKDATRNQTVLDPQGLLLWQGAPQEIPFQVSDAEVSIDVVALCPIPQALKFELVTPSGKIIDAGKAGVEPNVRYILGPEVAYYRLMLPALLGDPAGSHRGLWRAMLSLRTPDEIWAELKKSRDDRTELVNLLRRLREFAEKAMPYTLTVHAYSNLVLDAILNQDGFAPGARINLEARLWEYKLPLRGAAKVWAEVRDPSGAQSVLGFSSAGGGAHTATFVTSRSGVYELAIHAEGRTSANAKFSRHKILTAGVWAGGDEPYDPKVDRPEGSGQCAWILCILDTVEKSRELQARLKELGLDLGALRKCLEQHCNGAKAAMTLEKTERTTSEVLQALNSAPGVPAAHGDGCASDKPRRPRG